MPIKPSSDFNLNTLTAWVIHRLGLTQSLLDQVMGGEDDIAQYIMDNSIAFYSVYRPYHFNIALTVEQHSDSVGVYSLNRNEVPTEILKIIRKAGHSIGGINDPSAYGYRLNPSMGRGSSGMGLLNSAMLSLGSAFETTIVTKFHPPNEIEFLPRGWYDGTIITLGLVHPPDLQSLTTLSRETIRELALADVALHIKPYLHRFQEINAPSVSFSLNLEIFEKAEDVREKAIEKLKNGLLKDGYHKRIYKA